MWCQCVLETLCIYFYNYMEISEGVLGKKWVVVGAVLQRCVVLGDRVHLIKQMSLNLGSWASAFLLLTLTTTVCSEF